MEKQYITHLHNVDASSSGLLGYFDADDSYIIDDGILAELIKCNKLINSFNDDKISATATVGTFKIEFNIYLQDGEGNKKRAGLFVLEKAKLGFVEKELQTYVDSFVLDNTGGFIEEVKKRYHLFNVDESEGVDMSNSGLKLILAKKDGAVKKYKVLMPVLIDADKAYVAKMILLLKEAGATGKEVLSIYKDAISGIKVSKMDKSYWREAKLLLDKILYQNRGLFDEVTQNKMNAVQKAYVLAYSSAKEPVIMTPPPSKPKKKEEKKKDGGDKKKKKKPAAKDKGAGGASPKKDDKAKGKDTASGEQTFETKPQPAAEQDKQTLSKTEIFGYKIENNVKTLNNEGVKTSMAGTSKSANLGMER